MEFYDDEDPKPFRPAPRSPIIPRRRDLSLAEAFAYAIMIVVAFVAVGIVALWIALRPATAHDAHLYDSWCCGGGVDGDCRAVDSTEVIEMEEGKWKHIPTGSIFEKDRVLPSKNGRFHVCIGNGRGGSRLGFPYCIYILQGS